MGVKRFIITLLSGIFFLICLVYVFSKPPAACAQQSCSLNQVFGSCGAGGFACISPTPTTVPSATPIPPANPWIKVMSSNFSANSTQSFNFTVPQVNRLTFNTADPDEGGAAAGANTFMVGSTVVESGVLTAPDVSAITGIVSSNNWKINKYTKKKQFTPKKFLDYANARKDTNKITSLTDPLVPNKINIYSGAGQYVIDGTNAGLFQTGIDPATSLTGPTVLILNSDLLISRNINYKQIGGYVADISGYTPTALTIVVTGQTTITGNGAGGNEVNQINAVMILNNLTISQTVPAEDNGLKIKGNLIVSGNFVNNRTRINSQRPVMFIVTDPSMYTSLLPFLSTAAYEWKQIQ